MTPGDLKGQIIWIWGSSSFGVVAWVSLWGRCVLELATTLEREAKMENHDAFLWGRCFLELATTLQREAKIKKKGFLNDRQAQKMKIQIPVRFGAPFVQKT